MTSNSNAMLDLTKTNSPTNLASEISLKNDKKKKSIIPKIFCPKKNQSRGSHDDDDDDGDDEDEEGPNSAKISLDLDKKITGRKLNFMEVHSMTETSFAARHTSPEIEGLNLSIFQQSMPPPATEIREFRIFVATWNVGGKAPHTSINLEDFLQVEGSADFYVCGFQEIVPLNAGNVLVSEDNEPAAKWLVLINQALNHRRQDYTLFSDSSLGLRAAESSSASNNLFHKQSLKVLSKSFRAENRLLKLCNCPAETQTLERRRFRMFTDPTRKLCSGNLDPFQESGGEDIVYNMPDVSSSPLSPGRMSYSLVSSKQMVGIFLSVWAKNELMPHIGHVRVSSVGRGILGCLGNKGCISISMTLHRTSFCFVCSHLASGEKEGDELKRNSDVTEILKSTQFPKICKNSYHTHVPDRIIGHDRVIWLGDLNYRVALSYEETRLLLEDNDWDALLARDQLNLEREAGRVFPGFKEGKIMFAPTYKYTQNSDSYAGETVKSKKKRRTPAWCDRILWQGNGIEQLSYIRGESRFSDHRPVCAVFAIEAEVKNKSSSRFRKGYSCAAAADLFELDDCIPQRHSFYEFSTN